MFIEGIRTIARCTSRSGRETGAVAMADRAMNQNDPERDLHGFICQILAEMLPATAEEIALSAGLEPATLADCLDELTGRCRVMFNPLTKRYSLPKTQSGPGLAA